MKKQAESIAHRKSGPVFAIVIGCVLATAGLQVHAQNQNHGQGQNGNQNQNPGKVAGFRVTPPPLPVGSALVKVKGGMNDDEVKREERAHQHKTGSHKDVNKDDSTDGNNGNGGKKS